MLLPIALMNLQLQAKLDPAYMIQALYPAGSLKKDPTEAGGHAESSNMPKLMTSKNRLQSNLGVQLKATKAGVSINIYNASTDEAWLRAMDGNMIGWLEAQDGNEWKPIEYLPFADCGNSYHRVVLPPNYEWLFHRLVPKGEWQTQVRFAVLEKDKKITSPSILMSIPETRIRLNPAQNSQFKVEMNGYPILMPRQRG